MELSRTHFEKRKFCVIAERQRGTLSVAVYSLFLKSFTCFNVERAKASPPHRAVVTGWQKDEPESGHGTAIERFQVADETRIGSDRELPYERLARAVEAHSNSFCGIGNWPYSRAVRGFGWSGWTILSTGFSGLARSCMPPTYRRSSKNRTALRAG